MVKVKTRARWSPATSTKPQLKKRRASVRHDIAEQVKTLGADSLLPPAPQPKRRAQAKPRAVEVPLRILTLVGELSDGMSVTGEGIPAGARLVFPKATPEPSAPKDFRIENAMRSLAQGLPRVTDSAAQFLTYMMLHNGKKADTTTELSENAGKAQVNSDYAYLLEQATQDIFNAMRELAQPAVRRVRPRSDADWNEDIRCA